MPQMPSDQRSSLFNRLRRIALLFLTIALAVGAIVTPVAAMTLNSSTAQSTSPAEAPHPLTFVQAAATTNPAAASPGALPTCVGGEGFKAPRDYGAGAQPSAMAVGDFNVDAKSDLAVANRGGNSTSVLLGNGDGTFQTALNYAAGEQPDSIAVGDFNQDSRLDLAVANRISNNVSVLLGNGDGTFQTALNYDVGSNATTIGVGDFNGDGASDLTVGLIAEGSNNLGVLLGIGDGTFRPVTLNAINNQPLSVAVADFNRDGKLDLASANNGPDNLSVLLGKGDGTFQAPANYSTIAGSFFVVGGDFNDDAKSDLAVVNGNLNISIFLGRGDGTFQAASNYNAGTSPDTAAVGDVNGDGKLDLLVSNFNGWHVSVLLGKGDGTFQTAVNYDTGLYPTAVTVGKFNSDDRLDFAVGRYYSSGISVVLQRSPATHLRVETPASTLLGKAINLTVTALDAQNVSVPAYTCTVHFTSSDPAATLSADDDFNAGDEGVHTFNGFVLRTVGRQRLTVQDTQVPTISGSVDVTVTGFAGFLPLITR